MSDADRIRVLIADDQHLVRGAIAALLSMAGDIDVVADVADGTAALATIREHEPDVALLDIEMPGMDGLSVAAELKGGPTKMLVLTTFGRPGYLRRAMEAGAYGFVVKDAPSDHLADAIRRVHRGERVLDAGLAAAAMSSGGNPLTNRERDVLRAAADGATVADIAAQLFLSEGTVRNYLSAAIQKTGTRNRVEAVRNADANGWL